MKPTVRTKSSRTNPMILLLGAITILSVARLLQIESNAALCSTARREEETPASSAIQLEGSTVHTTQKSNAVTASSSQQNTVNEQDSRVGNRRGIGEYELLFTSMITSFFREPGLIPMGAVLDCGAQFGEQAMHLSRLAPSRQVYAIDPAGKNVNQIKKVIRQHILKGGQHPYPNLQIKQAALGANVGAMKVSDFGGGGGISNIQSDTMMEVLTIDSLFADQNTRLGFAHLDVEGFELEVLKGARKTIAKYRPVITTELFVHKNPEFSKELMNYINYEMDYVSYMVDEVCGSQMDIRNIINFPKEISLKLQYSDTLNVALAIESMIRVDAATIFLHALPCCAVGGACCPDGDRTKVDTGCCGSVTVANWVNESNMTHLKPHQYSFRQAKKSTVTQWGNIRFAYKEPPSTFVAS